MPAPPKSASGVPPWGVFPLGAPSLLKDLPILIAGLALFYGLLTFARYGVGPVNTQAQIQLNPGALPKGIAKQRRTRHGRRRYVPGTGG